ncbi:hypothetical protein [Erythrobacter sp. MTPC3]|uniref:hypothetical protein n=1 Tax=Erythrobacter sp. MTPC3 TaxID=3056564 RepID=UPI0036F22F3E
MEIELLIGSYFLIIFTAFASSGAAAILTIWFPEMARSWRVAGALLTLGFTLIVPVLGLIFFAESGAGDSSVSPIQDAAATFLFGALMALLGWPFAFLVSRALDRQRFSSFEVFE